MRSQIRLVVNNRIQFLILGIQYNDPRLDTGVVK